MTIAYIHGDNLSLSILSGVWPHSCQENLLSGPHWREEAAKVIQCCQCALQVSVSLWPDDSLEVGVSVKEM